MAHFDVLGERHLPFLLSEYVGHHKLERPHQGVGNVPLTGVLPPESAGATPLEGVRCRERLGGLLRHYTRGAA